MTLMNWGIMTDEAANTVATLLAVVFFAFVVEYGRVVRGRPGRKHQLKFAKRMTRGLVLGAVTWLLTEVIVLGVVNQGGVEAVQAVGTWILSGIGLSVMMWILISMSLTNPANYFNPKNKISNPKDK